MQRIIRNNLLTQNWRPVFQGAFWCFLGTLAHLVRYVPDDGRNRVISVICSRCHQGLALFYLAYLMNRNVRQFFLFCIGLLAAEWLCVPLLSRLFHDTNLLLQKVLGATLLTLPAFMYLPLIMARLKNFLSFMAWAVRGNAIPIASGVTLSYVMSISHAVDLNISEDWARGIKNIIYLLLMLSAFKFGCELLLRNIKGCVSFVLAFFIAEQLCYQLVPFIFPEYQKTLFLASIGVFACAFLFSRNQIVQEQAPATFGLEHIDYHSLRQHIRGLVYNNEPGDDVQAPQPAP